ncbi:zinc-dependent alcohol dehydrogenase family protein [Superficieibacter sp. HKU1]|uniref:zinc-dependent alcohol dehydrogenase family protein n=1 Tax=Superficieibacter sp. HKU1 TaxID=3031919 RepID=UPI0023E2D75A|nr:zinc-dependent alcohol dehydrogenase family protein [Superficieibacter sp. HKU1]WES70118.1 zinc-dependent alcohol dehydrogenase family protein [Superficieibacter sp. HKU1]
MHNSAIIFRKFGEPENVLNLERSPLTSRAENHIRVNMLFSPVNASDLIPVTGAYRHRILLPAVAGYEGVGVVIEAPGEAKHLLNKRVLPLRGEGTWQRYVDCPAEMAIPVPDDINSELASRSYINPLAAQLILRNFSPMGKTLLITAAGSDCAMLLGQWALMCGVEKVYGIYRSGIHAQTIAHCGIIPIQQDNIASVIRCASESNIVYDAVGGPLAELILNSMQKQGQFISYGLMSGQPYKIHNAFPAVKWFHIRNYLSGMNVDDWKREFEMLWPLLKHSYLAPAQFYQLKDWKQAIVGYRTMGRRFKPVISMQD